jgi:uncharacterized protein (DUF39 family)
VSKTYDEINAKIKQGQAVVVTAEEMIGVVAEKGMKRAAQDVDVVTTGTFGAMCSSGAFLNFGHAKPRIKAGGGKATLNGVVAYAGLAAVDLYIGATALRDTDPRNEVFPGAFTYGGGHVIEDLVAGRDVRLQVEAYGTDCYPRKRLDTWIRLEDLNEAFLFNPRNGYQNYNVAVNKSDKTIYTYMGTLKPRITNANYCSAGQLSPLLNDPEYRTMGVGTRIFLGGGVGYVTGYGTQHNPTVPRRENQVPKGGAGTLAVTGDLKQMDPKYLRGASFQGYGTTLMVGLGVAIPVLDEEMAERTAVSDDRIVAPVVDYSEAYPQCVPGNLGEVSYAQLKSGRITVDGKEVPTVPLSSYPLARAIAGALKEWIQAGRFALTAPVEPIPGPESGRTFKPLVERPVEAE